MFCKTILGIQTWVIERDQAGDKIFGGTIIEIFSNLMKTINPQIPEAQKTQIKETWSKQYQTTS
jgi:hypothetical protein